MAEIKGKLSELIPDDKNLNKHTQYGMSLLEKSVRGHKFGRSILVDKNNRIIAGNGIVETAANIGAEDIRIIETTGDELVVVKRTDVDLDTKEGREMALADNATSAADLEWDMDKMEEIESEWDIDVSDWGIDLPEEEEEAHDDDFDEDEIQAEPVCKEGDIWQLGEHRLMCGDSTDKACIMLLMNGEQADMVFTDPPYGINVVGNDGKIGGGMMAKNGKYKKIIGDDKDFDPSFIVTLFEKSKLFIWGANYFANLLPNSGRWIVWDKCRPEGTNFSDCELCWTNLDGVAVKKYKCVWNGMVREGEIGKRVHPTQKPIKLCGDIISEHSKKNTIVVDLFGGSGSTMIACEQLGRKCYMMELDPYYCDVIIARWEKLTGKKARKVFEK